jgi:hypothetical protein
MAAPKPTPTANESLDGPAVGPVDGSPATSVPAESRWVGALARLPWAVIAEGVFVTALLGVVLAWRALWLEQVEIGGDALKVWEFARQIASGGGLPHEFNHHTARFGLVVPATLAQLVWGSSAPVYFAAPLAASVALHGAVYAVTRKISGIVGGTLAVVLLLLFPDMVRMSSQILPELFGPTYTCLALLAALFYAEAKTRRSQLAWLFATGAFLFLAYGARISFLYYAPGIALLVWNASFAHADTANRSWFARKTEKLREHARWGKLVRFGGRMRLGDVSTLTLLVLLAMGVETLFYLVWTKQSSQLGVINQTHVGSARIAYHSARDFFRLYTDAGLLWQSALVLGAFSALGLFATARDRRAHFVVLTLLIYFFLNTFVLRKLSPPIPWMRPLPRYLLAAAPFIAIVIGAFVNEGFARAQERLAGWAPRVGRFFELRPWSITMAAALLVWSGTQVAQRWRAQWPKSGIVATRRTAEVLSSAFEAGIPLITASPGAKPLRAAGSLYIDPALMKVGETLPRFQAYQGSAGKVRYYAKSARKKAGRTKAVQEEILRRNAKKECAVILTQRNRFMMRLESTRPACPPLTWKALAEGAQKR